MLAHGISTGTVAAIAGAYAVVKTAEGRELVSATFVVTALMVHKRLLPHDATRQSFAGDGRQATWHESLRQRPRSAEHHQQRETTQGLEWVMQGIAHLHRSGVPANSDVFSSRGIDGEQRDRQPWLGRPPLVQEGVLWDLSSGACLSSWGSRKGLG